MITFTVFFLFFLSLYLLYLQLCLAELKDLSLQHEKPLISKIQLLGGGFIITCFILTLLWINKNIEETRAQEINEIVTRVLEQQKRE